MKRTHIILIVLIAVLIGAMIGAINDSSSYADFAEAFENPGQEFHVVGQLSKEKEMSYDPMENADLFAFWMVDNSGVERQVHLHKSKPQDFERSEQIVLIGSVEGDAFHANDILLKCPSKYTDGEVQVKEQA
ncbi:MAG: cytochrome c maturation protein CcmE [Flavobacteriales bacterium]|jgi:cytochrome c-type biogenesis protein CcmE|nr:cytochrome c maturation protein CcmE [Flavobacteriales bacterium]NCG29934.1 cytochrome c maturation protein CcmE [Bacteroidota bacterium]MBT3962539.1 cytochrome c maturation protein CcmE [Flavobacteriales bacterium]MBT4705686.1 cytochrome c maturation protein CcmE [Flavobacteriales bacterium]MBT4930962.1 cytochrome c maturation protein CcmE [Flavobacteriales bacterium]